MGAGAASSDTRRVWVPGFHQGRASGHRRRGLLAERRHRQRVVSLIRKMRGATAALSVRHTARGTRAIVTAVATLSWRVVPARVASAAFHATITAIRLADELTEAWPLKTKYVMSMYHYMYVYFCVSFFERTAAGISFYKDLVYSLVHAV